MQTKTKKIAAFRTVDVRRLHGELVDVGESHYEICIRGGEVVVRTPAAWVSLRSFLLSDAGMRVRHIYRRLGHHRLEALDGAILDFYPRGSRERGCIVIQGGELDGRAF